MMQYSLQGHYEHLLLLHVEIRLGFLPHLHCTNRLHLPHEPARSLQSPRLRIVWLSVGILSLLVLSRSCADDVSPFNLSLDRSVFTILILQSVTFVKARNEFRSAGITASIGRYAFGFTWGAWAAMFLATLFLFLGCGVSRKGDDHVRSTKRSGGRFGNVPFFRRQRSRRSTRGSFIETESQRRVKEEY